MTKPAPVATPPVVPTADDLLTQAATRLDVAKQQVERALAEANIALTTPAARDRLLLPGCPTDGTDQPVERHRRR
ncbi:hypothetical protein ACFU93_37380 [Streptomyces sp. NPDC057611]|uniref:hypothetical protein n=1 Tax=Streptomyces sp. NPDC057611 TaxID=3346182 RepID=UPI0036C3D6AA